MNNILKTLGGVLVILAIAGAYSYPESKTIPLVEQGETLGLSTGTTFNTMKLASIVFTPATGSATSTSILNTDSSDRKIQNFFYDCSSVGTSFTAYTGGGLVSDGVIFSFATTSTAAPATPQTTNAINLRVATTTPDSYNTIGTATTTPTALQRVWAAGSYGTISSNATNTASCVVGVTYFAS